MVAIKSLIASALTLSVVHASAAAVANPVAVPAPVPAAMDAVELVRRCEALSVGNLLAGVDSLLSHLVGAILDSLKADLSLVGSLVADIDRIIAGVGVGCLIEDLNGVLTGLQSFINEILGL